METVTCQVQVCSDKKISMTPEEAARYLKDFVYSLDQLDGVTGRVQVALGSPLGKSGRDKLLMEAFGLTREQAHDINNRLDASQPRKLRNVDMQEAFDVFPGLRKIVGDAVQAEKVREERRNSKNPAGQVRATEQQTPVDATPPTGAQLGFSVFNHDPVKVNSMTDKTQASEAKMAEREAAKAAKLAEREAKKAEREAAKAARAVEREAAKAARQAAREAARAERAAKLAELGEQPKMAALRSAKDRYVRAKNGSLRSNDDIAQAFDGLDPDRVIAVCMALLALERNPYQHLNAGQQSMNLRNKLRTAVKRGIVAIDTVRAAVQS